MFLYLIILHVGKKIDFEDFSHRHVLLTMLIYLFRGQPDNGKQKYRLGIWFRTSNVTHGICFFVFAFLFGMWVLMSNLYIYIYIYMTVFFVIL